MKSSSPSLRFRLLAGTLIWVVTTLGVAGWVLQSMFEQHLSRQFDNELSMHMAQLAAHLETDRNANPVLSQALSDPRLERPYSGLYWQVEHMTKDGGNVIVLRSRSLWDAKLQVPGDRLADGDRHTHRVSGPNGEDLRMQEQVMRPAEAPEQVWRLIVAADEKLLTEPLARFQQLLVLALSLLATGLLGAAIFQVIAGLRPLKNLREELARLRDGEQTTLSRSHPAEVQPLVDALNTLLIRNAEFVERARSQAGNLAHSLKTPLTVIANAASENQGPFAELVNAQVATARQQIDRHLALARVAASAQDQGQRCQVVPLVDGLIRVMHHVHPERHFNFCPKPDDETLMFRGEAQDFQEMMGNLLDNAGKWAKQAIHIRLSQTSDSLLLEIEDDGPGIPAAQRAKLLQRGKRGDENVVGSGLGLSIVDDLANLYGGSLALLQAPGGGLRVCLTLPRAGLAAHEGQS